MPLSFTEFYRLLKWQRYCHNKSNNKRPYHFDYKEKKFIKNEIPYFLSDNEVVTKRKLAENDLPPDIQVIITPVMPDENERSPALAPELGKHQFFILTLPYYVDVFERETCNPKGVLYNIAYELKDKINIKSVSPEFQYEYLKPLSDDGVRDCSEEMDETWHLKSINFDSVPNNIDGSGVFIGHPDTGWTAHPELNFDNNRISDSYDLDRDINIFDSNSPTAEEVVTFSDRTSLLYTQYHGTSTGGMLISHHASNDGVKGIATGATVISIRAINSVVRVSSITVALAIIEAVRAGAQVISLSLGGYPAPILECYINWAVANNVIVIAAAGNYNYLNGLLPHIIVAPAAYPACIAAGGSTIDDKAWAGSAHNIPVLFRGEIDISAPAECVHVPRWSERVPSSGQGSGTSFSTAIVAGAAALWLQRFNRDALINQLAGRSTLQELFRTHLQETARTPTGWLEFRDGPGILNLEGLLDQASLPNPSTHHFPPIINDLGGLLGIDVDGAAGNRFTPPSWVSTIFGDNAESVIDEMGEELTTAILSNPSLVSLIDSIGEGAEEIRKAMDSLEHATEETLDDTKDFIDEVVDNTTEAVEEFASDVSNNVSERVKRLLPPW